MNVRIHFFYKLLGLLPSISPLHTKRTARVHASLCCETTSGQVPKNGANYHTQPAALLLPMGQGKPGGSLKQCCRKTRTHQASRSFPSSAFIATSPLILRLQKIIDNFVAERKSIIVYPFPAQKYIEKKIQQLKYYSPAISKVYLNQLVIRLSIVASTAVVSHMYLDLAICF